MKTIQNKGLTFLKFEILEQYHEVRHFVTTRSGGFSKGNYKGLNLGFGTGDKPETVLENRYALSESLGIPLDWFVFMHQTHSANIELVNNMQKGSGAYSRNSAIENTDALITNHKNICLVVQVADCVPVFLLDTTNSVIAAIHAGWRGTLKEIADLTVKRMMLEYKSNPDEIVACMGPSIGPCSYEVGNEVRQQFIWKRNYYSEVFIQDGNRIVLDLWKANKMQLLKVGLKEENIEISNICTYCNHDIFYSSRYDKGETGRFVAGIMLQ